MHFIALYYVWAIQDLGGVQTSSTGEQEQYWQHAANRTKLVLSCKEQAAERSHPNHQMEVQKGIKLP